MKKTLVLGIGNPLISDDGIGTIVAQGLQTKLDNDLCDFKYINISGMNLIDIIQGYKNLVVVDGKMTHEGIPGDVSFFTIDTYFGMTHLDNYHDVSFRDLITLGRSLDLDIPPNVHIVAIEIVEDTIFSDKLSILLQNYYDSIFEKVLAYVKKIQ